MKYEILDEQGEVTNIIVADLGFVEQHYPGKYREVAATANIIAENFSKAKRLLEESDWADLPSVRNTSINPHMLNGDEYDAYRAALRSIVVSKPAVVDAWPVKPSTVWST